MNINEIVIYETPNKEIKIDVRLEKETIWLNLNQIKKPIPSSRTKTKTSITLLLKYIN